MLQKISLKNVKMIDAEGITIEPGRITTLVGANGTGKSSLFQMLLVMRQSAESQGAHPPLMFVGPEINLGSFRNVVHNNDTGLAIGVELCVSYENLEPLQGATPTISPSGTYSYDVAQFDNYAFEHFASIGGKEGTKLTASITRYTPPHVEPESISLADVYAARLEALPMVGRPIDAKLTGGIAEPRGTEMHRAISRLLSTIQRFLQDVRVAPALRGLDSLAYAIQSGQGVPPPSLSGSERSALEVANTLANRPEVADEVADLLNTVLNSPGRRLRHRIDQGRIAPEMTDGRRAINIFNESFGLNQLIIPAFHLVTSEPGAMVGIEEPEIHLHPKAQAAFADVMVKLALRDAKQIMVTTHSEHMLMGFLTSVAKGELQPDDLVVYEFWRESDAAKVRRLEVNQYGQIQGGLREFMEVDMDAVGELIAARLRH